MILEKVLKYNTSSQQQSAKHHHPLSGEDKTIEAKNLAVDYNRINPMGKLATAATGKNWARRRSSNRRKKKNMMVVVLLRQ